ncbi:MAG: extracellular solute-binding protein [Phreatobacter sp.]
MTLAAQVEGAEITLIGYRSSFQENYIKAVIEPFQAAHPDIKVTYYGVQNAAFALGLMRAQRDAPQADVVLYDLSVAKIAHDEGLIAPVDLARVPNYANISDIGKDLGAFAPPITYDTLSLIYNVAAFPSPPTSWTAMWERSQAGKVVIPAQGGGDIQAIALTLIVNRMAGQSDYRKGVRAGVERLVQLAPSVQSWEPKPDAYTVVANGTANLGIGWNARSQFYVDQTGGRMQTVAPAEGTVTQVNVISPIAKSPNQAAVATFINYALGAEAQKRFSEAMFYAPTNQTTVLDAAVRARIPLLDPAQRDKLVAIDWMSVGAIRDTILGPWRRQIIPASR